MMICEKCEQEMQGSVVQCPHCRHNHVLQRIDAWRERRNHQISSLHRQNSEQPAPAPQHASKYHLRANAKDSTLIRFPKRPTPPTTPATPSESVASLPEWRQRLDARLKEIREQRALEVEPPPAPRPESKPDRNPIIESALNRIQRATYLQPITPSPRARYAAAAELAPEPVQEPISAPVAPPAVNQSVRRPAEAKAPALPKTISAAPLVREPLLEAEPPVATAVEDLRPEVAVEAAPQQEVSVVAEKAEAAPNGTTTLEAASLAKRSAAAVIDAEIIAFSMLPLFAVYFFLGGWFEATAIYTPILIAVLLITVYFFVTYALAGRTMGMAFLNLHLASQSPTEEAAATPTTVTFTFRQAALRALGGTISLLLFPINILCIAKSYDRLSISDYLSGTQVVRIKK